MRRSLHSQTENYKSTYRPTYIHAARRNIYRALNIPVATSESKIQQAKILASSPMVGTVLQNLKSNHVIHYVTYDARALYRVYPIITVLRMRGIETINLERFTFMTLKATSGGHDLMARSTQY